MRRNLPLFCVALMVLACERPDLDTPKEKGTQAVALQPLGHGLGTQESPLTAGDVLAGLTAEGGATNCWVMGYAVGSTYRTMNNAQFSVPTTYAANVLLADDSLCMDADLCVPVELAGTASQGLFSLASCPQMWRRLLVVRGTAGRYFSRPGLRAASLGYWLPDFDLATISPVPTPWEERDSIF